MTKILFESTKKDLYIEKLYLVLQKVINNFYLGAAVKYVLDYRLETSHLIYTHLYHYVIKTLGLNLKLQNSCSKIKICKIKIKKV